MFTLLVLAAAPQLVAAVPAPVTPAFQAPPTPRLVTDQSADGTVWVRGVDYKLALGRDGARYFPRERGARRLHELALGVPEVAVGGGRVPLDGLVSPRLEGRAVTYERGPVTELWELDPRGARQSFVVAAPLGEGDLVVRLPLGGDVLPEADAGADADGALRFSSPEGGVVEYGAMLVLDAAGLEWRGPSVLDGDSIVLRVPGEVLADAVYPIVVDPLITTRNYDGGTDDPTDPDSAVDQSSQRLLVVFHDTFASNDSDIIARRFTLDGAFIDEVAVDISNEETIDASVAGNEAANQFLIAWTQTGAGLFNTRRIEARTRAANSNGQGPELELSFAQGNESTPDVGGTSFGSASAPYYVVWSERGTVTGQNIRGRTVTPSGALGSATVLDGTFGDEWLPTVSKDAGPNGRWGVAYQVDLTSTTSQVNVILVAMNGSVAVSGPDFFFEGQGNNSRPDIAGDGEQFLVVFQQRRPAGDLDVAAYRYLYTPAAQAATYGLSNLTEVEPGATPGRHQAAPAVASVQGGFVYAYQEAASTSTSAFDVYLATVDTTLGSTTVEGHVLASPGSVGYDGSVNLCALTGGVRAFPVWTKIDTAGDRDVNGALYERP